MVVGAAYSHADMLKFESLFVMSPSQTQLATANQVQQPLQLILPAQDPAILLFYETSTFRDLSTFEADVWPIISSSKTLLQLPVEYER